MSSGWPRRPNWMVASSSCSLSETPSTSRKASVITGPGDTVHGVCPWALRARAQRVSREVEACLPSRQRTTARSEGDPESRPLRTRCSRSRSRGTCGPAAPTPWNAVVGGSALAANGRCRLACPTSLRTVFCPSHRRATQTSSRPSSATVRAARSSEWSRMSASSIRASAAAIDDARCRLLQVRPPAGVDGHRAPGVGQRPRGCSADAPSCPGHHRHLPVEAEPVQQGHT